MIASRELFAPTSCILLVTHYQIFQECCSIVQIADNPKGMDATGSPLNLSPERMGSQGEPWQDAIHWQGQESQFSLASTQGVDESFSSESMRPWG